MDMPQDDMPAGRSRLLALAAVTVALTAFAVAQGLSYPLFTMLMQRQGMPPALIGLSAAMLPLGLILSASFIPTLVQRFGARALAVGCAVLGGACFAGIGLLQNEIGWFGLRFLLGLVINPLYVLGEVWALAAAPPARRGRVMGIFNAVMGCGYALGPLTLIVVGADGLSPFAIAVAAFALCAAVLAAAAGSLPGFETGGDAAGGSIIGFARLAPALLVAVLVSAATQQSTYSLLPVFAAGYGVPEEMRAPLITALSLGNIVFQIPLGILAERFGGRAMLMASAVATGICALFLPVVVGTIGVWPLLLVIGGVGYGVYTMALVELGTRFSGQRLIAGNAAFALMWGAGGIIGPPGTGALIQLAGPIGLPLVIVMLCAVLVAFGLYRQVARRA